MPLTAKTEKRRLKPKASTTGAFSFDIREGDTLRFDGDQCHHYRGDQCLGQYHHAFDDDTSEPLTKAPTPAAKKPDPPLQQGERWITLKPQGPDSDAFVRVKIRQHSDGTASVIGGAGGKLNQLHLSKLKSPEEWKASAAERRAKRQERERKRQESQTQEEQTEEDAQLKQAKERHRGERHQNALETLKALSEAGISHGLEEKHLDALVTPASPDTDSTEAKAIEALAREAVKKAEAIQRTYEQKLITDHEARAAAKLGDVDLDGLGNPLQHGQEHTAYSAEDGEAVSSMTKLPNGQWLVRSPDGADQTFDDWERAAKTHAGNVNEHDGTVGERSQADDFYNPRLWMGADPNVPEFDPAVAGKIAALAQQRKDIDRSNKAAEKAIKRGQPWSAARAVDLGGVTEIDEQAAIAALESDAKTIEDAIVHGRLLDIADLLNPKQMASHLRTGGLAQLGEIASEVLKANPVDPALVQQLGHNEAAKLLAYQIRQGLSDGEYQAVVAAQAAHHGEWSTRYAQEVIDRNQPVLDALKVVHSRMMEIEQQKSGEPSLLGGEGEGSYTPDQLIELDSLANQSSNLQASLSKDVGTALGQLQASAAMTLALEAGARSLRFAVRGDSENVVDVPGLLSRETAEGEQVPSIWAHYGLTAEDFALEDGPDSQLVSVKPSGMEKLAGATYDPDDRADYERAIAIKRGEFDQENFTPDGFAYRPTATFTDVQAEAQHFDTTFDYSPEMSDEQATDAIRQYIGARVANGSDPLEVRRDLFMPKTYIDMGFGSNSAVQDRVIALLTTHEKNLKANPDRPLTDTDIVKGYRAMGDMEAARQRQLNAHLSPEAIHSQTLDHDTAKEAAHRALAAMPTAKAALKPLEQLNPKERKLLRDYAVSKLLDGAPDPHKDGADDDDVDVAWEDEDNEAVARAKKIEEEFTEVGLDFGDVDTGVTYAPNVRPALERIKRSRKQAIEKIERSFAAKMSRLRDQHQAKKITDQELDAQWQALVPVQNEAIRRKEAEFDELQRQVEAGEVEPKAAAQKVYKKPSPWNDFSQLMGGDKKAYEAVQDQIKGDFLHRFAGAYSSIQGKPLMMGVQPTAHSDRLVIATASQEERTKLLAKIRSDIASDLANLMNRGPGGRFAQTDDIMERYDEMKGDSTDQPSLFGDLMPSKPEKDESPKEEVKPSSVFSRTMLGETAEQQLDQALAEVLPGFGQLNDAVNLYPEVRWNGSFVAHQRGLKFLQERKKVGIHYSAGAGKSALMLGAFTHLHSQGAVQRSIVAVPSNIVGQIVGECATFLEPGKYNYSGNIGWDREKRIEALKNPDMHLHFTTRESLTNDLLHLVEKHTGVDPQDFQNTDARSEDDRRALMLTALKNEGIDPSSLLFSVDEAHDLSRRMGTSASKRSLALDALAYHSSHYIHATGSPLKNDVSEIGDFLQKVGAPEAADMKGFMARYGRNTEVNRRALQRIMAKYSYAIDITPTTKRDGVDVPLAMREEKPRIPLTPYQKTQRAELIKHYDAIKEWKARELPKARAAKMERGDSSPLNGADLAHAWDDPAVRDAISALAPEDYANLSDEEKQAKIGGQVIGASALHYTALNRLYHNTPYEHNAKAQHAVKEAKRLVGEGKPGVIFCASSKAAEMLHKQMAKEGLRVGFASGDSGAEEKDRERLKFSPSKGVNPETDVFIVTDAMQTGSNLQRGKFLMHFDVPITQKAYEQRSKRIYRRGQTEDVEVHTLMADAPEDEIALARMERKAKSSEIFQGYDDTMGHSEVLDDSGLAARISMMRANQPQQAA